MWYFLVPMFVGIVMVFGGWISIAVSHFLELAGRHPSETWDRCAGRTMVAGSILMVASMFAMFAGVVTGVIA